MKIGDRKNLRLVIFVGLIVGLYLVSQILGVNGLLYIIFALNLLLIGKYAFTLLFNCMELYSTLRLQHHLQSHGEVNIKDVTDKYKYVRPEVSPLLLKIIGELLYLEFEYIGHVELTAFSDTGNLNYQYISDDGKISATVGGGGSKYYVRFFSHYEDESILETVYPSGFHIETPELRSRTIRHSVERTLSFHQYQMLDFAKAHGEPIIIPHVESLINASKPLLRSFNLVRVQYCLKQDLRKGIINGIILASLIALWLQLNSVNSLDTHTLQVIAGTATVSLLLIFYLNDKENQHYADKRKFQKNQA